MKNRMPVPRLRLAGRLCTVMLAFALTLWLSACGGGRQEQADKVLSLLLKLDAYRDQHFPPANHAAYARVFPDENRVNTSATASRPSEVFDPKAAEHFRTIAPAEVMKNPKTRQALADYFNTTGQQWHLVEEAVKGGGFYPKYGDTAGPESGYWIFGGSLSLRSILTFSQMNSFKALYALSNGDTTQTIDLLTRNLKLGEAMLGKSWEGGNTAATIVFYTCREYDSLLWQPLSGEAARYALERCRAVRFPVEEHKNLAAMGRINSIAMMHLPGRERYRGRHNLSETIALWLMGDFYEPLTYVLYWIGSRPERDYGRPATRLPVDEFIRPENRAWINRVTRIRKPGVLYFGKITTVPAIRKRLRHILATEPFFQQQPPIFEEKDLEGLWPEIEIQLRRPVLNPYESAVSVYETEVEYAAAQLDLLRAALAARVFRAEKGKWPTDVAELQAADLITSPTTSAFGKMRIVDLYSELKPADADPIVLREVRRRFLEPMSSQLPPFPISGSSRESGTGTFSITLQKVQKEYVARMETALAALEPLMSDVRVTELKPVGELPVRDYGQPNLRPPSGTIILYDAKIEGAFVRPKCFWWACMPKDDLIAQGFNAYARAVVFGGDPQANRLCQFIGWE